MGSILPYFMCVTADPPFQRASQNTILMFTGVGALALSHIWDVC